MTRSPFLRLKWLPKLLAGLASLTLLAASAQWQWLDKDGRKVYSDRAPPPDVLDKNIVKRPSRPVAAPGKADVAAAAAGTAANTPDGASLAAQAAAAAANSAARQATTPFIKLPTVDKDLEARKKLAADAEAGKRRSDEERVAKLRAEACTNSRSALAQATSGARIRRINDKGEPEVLDDEGRAQEARKAQSGIDANCL